MKFCLSIVLALVAIAYGGRSPSFNKYGGRLPLPLALQDKYHFLMKDDPYIAGRVIGGAKCIEGERPYQCALLRRGSFGCGCSLIAKRTVLTAAHCIDGSESTPNIFTIRYGVLKNTGGFIAKVIRVIKHESFSSTTADYDYAILQLEESYNTSSNASIVKLVDAGYEPKNDTILGLSGWGKTSGSGSTMPSDLMCANLTYLNRTVCDQRWTTTVITERMICAYANTTTACNGDSGGPVTVADGGPNHGKQCGVVSWGSSGCKHATYPAVYANLGERQVSQWIKQNTID